jgi:hypothetical protein
VAGFVSFTVEIGYHDVKPTHILPKVIVMAKRPVSFAVGTEFSGSHDNVKVRPTSMAMSCVPITRTECDVKNAFTTL